MGYWSSSYSYLATNAKYNNYGWDCGDSHEVSLKDGTVRAYDDDGITVEYYYSWIAQKIYKTYDTPVEPTAPTAPVKGEAAFETTPYVTAVIEDIEDADIREYIAEPVKKSYIEMLSHMALFEVPEIANVINTFNDNAAADSDNTVADVKAASDSKAAAVSKAAQKEIAEDLMPLASAEKDSTELLMAENDVPMASSNGFWALINLIAAALTVILGACMAVFGLRRNDEDSDSKADKWTVLMVVILAIQVLAMAAAKKSKDEYVEADADIINA